MGGDAIMEQARKVRESERMQLLLAGRAEQECLEQRIASFVVPTRTLADVLRRIPQLYDTVAEGVKDIQEGVPAVRTNKLKCTNPMCGNDDQSDFQPGRDGSVACRKCGECLCDYIIHEGEEFRNISGEESRTHHGPAINAFYSSSYQLGTQFMGLKGGKRSTGKETDFATSNIGKDGAVVGTRVEYKDDQKGKAFRIMSEAGANLQLHDLVLQKAKGLFASYRDVLDRLYDFETAVAACLVAAHLEILVEEGGQLSFACPQCGERLAVKKDAEFHCKTLVGSSGVYANGGSSASLNRSASGGTGGPANGVVDLTGMSESAGAAAPHHAAYQDVEVHRLDLRGVQVLLMQVAQAEGQNYMKEVAGVCEGLRKMLAEPVGTDDEDEARGVAHTAGQLLVMASQRSLARWCGGNQQAAKLFFDQIQKAKKRKMERDRLAEEEESDRKRKRERMSKEEYFLDPSSIPVRASQSAVV